MKMMDHKNTTINILIVCQPQILNRIKDDTKLEHARDAKIL